MSLSMYMVHQSFWQMTTQLQNSLKFSPSRITSYMIYGSSMYCAYSSKLFLSHNLIIILFHYYRKDTHLAEGVLKCMSLLFKSSSITSDKPFFELLSIFLAMIENDESAPVEPRLSQCNELNLKFF